MLAGVGSLPRRRRLLCLLSGDDEKTFQEALKHPFLSAVGLQLDDVLQPVASRTAGALEEVRALVSAVNQPDERAIGRSGSAHGQAVDALELLATSAAASRLLFHGATSERGKRSRCAVKVRPWWPRNTRCSCVALRTGLEQEPPELHTRQVPR